MDRFEKSRWASYQDNVLAFQRDLLTKKEITTYTFETKVFKVVPAGCLYFPEEDVIVIYPQTELFDPKVAELYQLMYEKLHSHTGHEGPAKIGRKVQRSSNRRK